jgi:hypothetical protein
VQLDPTAIAIFSPARFNASLDEESDAVSAESEAARAKAAESVDPDTRETVPTNTPLSFRLQVFGNLFTPQEQVLLNNSSQLFGTMRAMARTESASPALRNAQASAGSAYASAISASLIYAGGRSSEESLLPLVWGQPGGSLRDAWERQMIPMATDWAERSRAEDSPTLSGGASVWMERAVALAPMPHGSQLFQAGATGVRIGALSLISGKWPRFGEMDRSQFAKFCRVWIKRTLNAALATGIGSLMMQKNVSFEGGEGQAIATPASLASFQGGRLSLAAPQRSQAAFPVTIFHGTF